VQPISRRRALQLGGLGLAGVALGGTGLAWSRESVLDPRTGADWSEPKLLSSENGLLRARLEAAEGPLTIAGREATAYGYNGGLPGPTLRLRPGDRLQVQLVNRLDAVTNLHVHGLYVSPEGNGDNVFVAVQPGESFDYDYQLPDDHPPGVYWYHPHHHGMVADQVFGGLYGAIIVEDPDDPPVTRERVLVVSDITLDDAGRLRQPSTMARMMGREGELVLVNGQVRPALTARPGERERWRIINACSARYLRLRLDGQQMQLLGIDSGRFPQPRDLDEVVLATGNRADLLVTAAEGTSTLDGLAVDRGSAGMMGGSGTPSGNVGALATLQVTGTPGPELPAMPAQPAPVDLRGVEPAARRRLTFAMGMGGAGMSFTIDGKEFDAQRIDQTVQVGTVEEWTLTNASSMDHPVHLHVWPMQIVAEAGRPVDGVIRQDVVNVPARSDVTVRVAFDEFGGRTVYHCHILDHEDNGMMGVVEAQRAS
jgi:FtsP/CotA-like multicopper oxidase with cupredoxin domain